MRLWYSTVCTLIIIGVLGAYFLYPRSDEVGLMHYHDKKYRTALEIYEEQWKNGDHSPAIVIPLAQIYIQYGRIEDAVTIIEIFLKKIPDHVEAWQMLGRLYKQAQRPDGYLRTREALRFLDPNLELLRELSGLYNGYAEYEKQRDVLIEINTYKEVKPKEVEQLSQLYAALGQHQKAVATINDFLEKYPNQANIKTIELGLSLILEIEKKSRSNSPALHTFIREHANAALSIDDATRLASILLMHKRPEMGLIVLKKQLNKEPSTDFLITLTELRLLTGEKAFVKEELWNSFEKRSLHPALAPYLIRLLIQENEQKKLELVLSEVEKNQLDDAFLLNLAVQAARTRNSTMVLALLYQMGEEIVYYPFIDLLLEIAITESDEKILQHDALPQLDDLEKQELLDLLIASKRDALVFSLLRGPFRPKEMDDALLEAAVEWALLKKEPEFAKKLLVNYLKDNQSPKMQTLIGRVMLRVEPHTIVHWATTYVTTPSVLSILAGEAATMKQHQISLAIARDLYTKYQRAIDIPVLAAAYVATNHSEEALPFVKILLDRDPSNKIFRNIYKEALISVAKSEQFYQSDLKDFLHEEIQYVTEVEEKREIAFVLLEVCDDKKTAIQLFQELAKGKPVNDPDVEQLTYLWGPASNKEAREWLVKRAFEANEDNLILWCEKLFYIEALDALQEIAQLRDNIKLREQLVYALDQRGREQELEAQLDWWIAGETDSQALFKAVKIAKNLRRKDLALRAYEKAMKHFDANMALTLEQAMFSYELGDKNRAFEELFAALGRQGQQIEGIEKNQKEHSLRTVALSAFAGLAWERGEKEIAQEAYRSYLNEPNREEKVLPIAYIRLGDKRRGIQAYHDLLRQNPDDMEQRAALAHVLMDEGRHEQAASVLNTGWE